MNVAAAGTARSAVATSQYDAIADCYQRTKQSPIRQYVENYSLFGLLGELRGLDVLDLACGEGHYTRRIRERGARRVVGVDVSPRMIDLARAQENGTDTIEYRVHDAQDLPRLGAFDVVCAAYLLHYARDVGELRRMCQAIARQLSPGGRFVAINENPEQPESAYAGYLRYGLSKTVAAPRREGSPITYAMISGRELFRFVVYHFERATYERVLAEAGFVDVRWHALQLDPEGGVRLGAEYWREYLDNPPVIGLTCRLPA